MTRTLIAPLAEAPDYHLDAIAAACERLLKRVPEFHTLKPRQQAFLIEGTSKNSPFSGVVDLESG